MSISNLNLEWRFENNLINYSESLKFMEQRAKDIFENREKSLIWVLEHPPIYTAGISSDDNDLLNNSEIEVIKTNRGGKYTYHGPGMKIIYTMLDLKKLFYPQEPDISRFVEFLESWIMAVLSQYNIVAEIRKNRVGLWVNTSQGEKKISAIGIKIKRWVSYHGIAININPDLKNFENIVPCGLKEYGVTSFSDLNKNNFDEQKFYEILQKQFFNISQKFF
jgi:lipoyl(octanoyl) transferase